MCTANALAPLKTTARAGSSTLSFAERRFQLGNATFKFQLNVPTPVVRSLFSEVQFGKPRKERRVIVLRNM